MDDYNDICNECGGYGDDYYYDDDKELICACDECWVTKMQEERET